ncbi:MAG: exopolysaccharide Pel transporter PelG [Magnetococcales bacterium]|nr:exopolysaccharide Pel transporter PelG [Magnetococcales bacterium]
MAGIGFVLRNLTRRDDLMGLVSGYGYSALVATGPWIFTSLALGGSLYAGSAFTTWEEQAAFRLIIIYNFAFSLVFSGPVIMVVTRYLADMVYKRDVKEVPGMVMGALTLLMLIQVPVAVPFYMFFVDLEPITRVLAVINFFLINGIWLTGVFLSALKDFNPIIRTFGIGMVLGMILNVFFSEQYGMSGMLTGFNLGLGYIFFSLMARILSEYPYRPVRPFAFLRYFRIYWELALGGFIYNLGAWIDKIIMWTAPESETVLSHMVSYPDYDSAMFLAFLTIIPAMSSFVISMETSFFENYLTFYRDIQRHAPWERIDKNHKVMMAGVMESGRNFLILQGSISLTAIMLAPNIFDWLGVNYLQMSMFRIGVLGSFYHAMALFFMILLAYFDFRRVTLGIQTLFFVTNAGFTYITLQLGFPYYGYGYFLSTLVTFSATYWVSFKLVKDLPYQTFVKQNASV